MKYLHSERGYTLIITLLLVVLILLFTATFTVASMNQAKQVERTDESYVATSTAEMGIEKFISLINWEIENNKDSYNLCINESEKTDYDCYKEIYTKIYNNILVDPTKINEPDFFRIDIINSVSPNLLNETLAKNHLIHFKSVGFVKNSDHESIITASIKLPFSILSPSSEQKITESSFSLPVEIGVNTNSVTKNTDIKAKDINDYFSKQKINYFSGSADFEQVKTNNGQLPNGLSDIKIYAEKTLNFDKFVDTTNQTVLQANKIIFSHSSSVKTDIKNSFLRANVIDFCTNDICNAPRYDKSINVSNSCLIVDNLTPFLVNSLNFTDSNNSDYIKPLKKTKIYYFNSKNLIIPEELSSYYQNVSKFSEIDSNCIIGNKTIAFDTNNVKLINIEY